MAEVLIAAAALAAAAAVVRTVARLALRPFLRVLPAARRHHLPACSSGWRAVQRHRIEHAAVW